MKIVKYLALLLAVALVGASSATGAALITGAKVKDSSLTGRDIRNGSLTAADLKRGVIPTAVAGKDGRDGASGLNGGAGKDGATGPAGAQGPAGGPGQPGGDGLLTGVQAGARVRATITQPDETQLLEAPCASGTQVVSGGMTMPDNGVVVTRAFIDPQSNSYSVQFVGTAIGSMAVSIEPYCAS